MFQLSNCSATDQGEEWVEYLNLLREGVLEAYSGIIHGLKESGKLHLFKEHVNTVLMLVKEISDDQTSQLPVIKAAVGVVGDLILVFQQELTAYVGQAPFLSQLVQTAIRSQEPKLLQNAHWLQGMLVRFGGMWPGPRMIRALFVWPICGWVSEWFAWLDGCTWDLKILEAEAKAHTMCDKLVAQIITKKKTTHVRRYVLSFLCTGTVSCIVPFGKKGQPFLCLWFGSGWISSWRCEGGPEARCRSSNGET